MRQKILIAEIGYKENFDGVGLEPYPIRPDDFTPIIVHTNSDRRTDKIVREVPDIDRYLHYEEQHPAAATFFDELRLAGFVKLESPMHEYITPESRQIYSFVKGYKKILEKYILTLSIHGQ